MTGIFFVIGMAFVVGFLLIFAISLSGQKRFDGIGTIDAQQLPNFERFGRIVRDMAESMKLEIDRIESHPDEQSLDIYAHTPTPITGAHYLIHAVLAPPAQVIPAAEIVELSNVIIQDRLSKGIFMTTGRFTEDLSAISELAPMEFVDGAKFEELAQQYKIPLSEA